MTLIQVLTLHDSTPGWTESGTLCTSAILVRYICILGQMFSAFSRQEPYDAAKKPLFYWNTGFHLQIGKKNQAQNETSHLFAVLIIYHFCKYFTIGGGSGREGFQSETFTLLYFCTGYLKGTVAWDFAPLSFSSMEPIRLLFHFLHFSRILFSIRRIIQIWNSSCTIGHCGG